MLVNLNELNEPSLNEHELNEYELNEPSCSLVQPYSPAPYYSHRWPGHPSTHPHPLLFCGDGSLTPQPNQ